MLPESIRGVDDWTGDFRSKWRCLDTEMKSASQKKKKSKLFIINNNPEESDRPPRIHAIAIHSEYSSVTYQLSRVRFDVQYRQVAIKYYTIN